jgi:hypothetical protein
MNKILKKFSIYIFASLLFTLTFAALIYTDTNSFNSWPLFSTDENDAISLTKFTSLGSHQDNAVVYKLNKKSEHYKHLQNIMTNTTSHITLKPSNDFKNSQMFCKYDINVDGQNQGRIKVKKQIASENRYQKYIRAKNAIMTFLTLTAETIAEKAAKIGHSFERRGTHWKKTNQQCA